MNLRGLAREFLRTEKARRFTAELEIEPNSGIRMGRIVTLPFKPAYGPRIVQLAPASEPETLAPAFQSYPLESLLDLVGEACAYAWSQDSRDAWRSNCVDYNRGSKYVEWDATRFCIHHLI